MFFTGDPHMAQGDGEVALTAMEGSLRPTFRLTVIQKGAGVHRARPSTSRSARRRLLGADRALRSGRVGDGGNETCLDVAMRNAVRRALEFLVDDRHGRAGRLRLPSAASDFQVSQVVDRTTGVHALIRKADFDRRGRH